jgi:4-amino-4-deoxy-L-arabinose transferase-like glycosyltransferase
MPKITTKQHFSRQNVVRIGLVLLIVCFYFFGLNIPLLGPDEPRYAQVAREMFERGDWITPTLGGFNWFEKPALLYWLEITSYSIFGVSEFSARLGSALFGLATVASLWLLGRELERRDPSRKNLADWLALITASSIGMIVFSRGASFDIILTFPVTAALVSFFVYELREERSGSSLALFYIFIGIALLAKGLIGILLPFGIVGLYYLLSRRVPSRNFLISLAWGTAICSLVASVWYVPMYYRHGWQFIDEFIIQHHFQRFTSNKYQHPQPFHFFFWVLPLMTIPWLPFFAAAVWKILRELFSSLQRKPGDDLIKLKLFSFAWVIVPVLFFSASGSKLPGYVLPALPGALLLTGLFFWDLSRRHRSVRLGVPVISVATFLLLACALVFIVPRFAAADSVKSLIQSADAEGFSGKPVLMFHTVSHNAEFYAAGRIVRNPSGAQEKITSLDALLKAVAAGGNMAVVLMPVPYLEQIKTEKRLSYAILGNNGETVAVGVKIVEQTQ